jgi:hypothetical protein
MVPAQPGRLNTGGQMTRVVGRRRVILGVVLTLAGLGMALARPVGTQAVSACRSDPYITLSNGKVVQLAATISDTVTDVKQVTYVLHAPKGTTVVAVSYSGDLAANLEKFTFYADDAAGSYDGYTTVYTGTPNVAVAAIESVGKIQGFTQNATSGQTIWTHVVSP